jgi:hypothetical protein
MEPLKGEVVGASTREFMMYGMEEDQDVTLGG